MTIQQALEFATSRLAAEEPMRSTARRDAELLLMHSASLTRTGLIAYPERELAPTQAAAFDSAIQRRLRHEPVQYIIGTQEFYGLDLTVSPAVLIPRPETEHLVESVLGLLPHDRPLAIADIGAGSGAIAIALAVHLPQAQLTAFDLSPTALAVAEANARRHQVAERIRFLHSDLLGVLAPCEREACFDAIVSNPPYVPLADAASLAPQVRDHEPPTALYAGEDGLTIYRRLIPQAEKALRPGGLLALEMGYGQRDALAGLLGGWQDLRFVDDLQGIPRVALARR
ncbi:MAG: peptide chain release factor N(5)-glutamine methyltransferase [Edaphobacter sp.]|uniref:peptide chain release factor N(5)-glutamine methyltransferase n=1 Tax=Edaphobacter sp. TaxID=1934404 RepID=UPI002386CAF2|nr:peptide chain release factor N(5)-glutamine methyltransferase [Edaphobacter sp.]MDE1176800.1 peptide chain release factor N(5)-glutamine methyltransferase [Edaphobacter sp.]